MKKGLCILVILCFSVLAGCSNENNKNLGGSAPTIRVESKQNELDMGGDIITNTPTYESDVIQELLPTNAPEYTQAHMLTPTPTAMPTPTPILVTEYTKNLIYELSDDGTYYIVRGARDKHIQELFIPKIYDGKPVMKIGIGAFEEYTSLKTVVIPNTVTEIWARAFANCKEIETVVLSENLESVAREVFYGCARLKKVQLPKMITEIEEGAFRKSGLREVNIPEGVVTIGYRAFGETYLKELHIPASLEKIGGAICYPGLGYMSSLEKITVSEENERFYESGNCLLNNDGLLIMGANGSVISESTIGICEEAFYGCNLGKVYLPKTVTKIYDNAFGNATIEELELSEGLEYIGKSAFESVDVLSEVCIPKSVKELCSSAFASCFYLKEVRIEGKTSIGFYAFSYCTGLEKVVLSENVTNIDEEAFDGCSEVVLYVADSSYAKQYALENEIPYKLNK